MSDQPMDLGSLADVESPEVVRKALREFRRRALRNAVWVIVVVALLAVPTITHLASKTLQQKIAAADGADPGTVYTDGQVTVVLARVADLGDHTGIRVIATSGQLSSQSTVAVGVSNTVSEHGLLLGSSGPFADESFEVLVPADGRLTVTVDVTPACTHPAKGKPGLTGCFVPGERLTGNEPKHVFTIDLGAAGVPARLWQKGGSR